jgi:2-dehydropantoate 2-reductase
MRSYRYLVLTPGSTPAAFLLRRHRDLPARRPTEIDSLNGYVVRRGAALGIATPVSEILVAMVKLLEESALIRRSG